MAANGRTTRRPPPSSRRELEVRAEALAGHAVSEVATALGWTLPPDARRAKGFVGQLVEAALGADPTAGDGPDFPALGVELKTIPIGRRGRPSESTFCCSIAMERADREQWDQSRLRRRLACVLWVPVEAADVAPLEARCFGAARLWSPGQEEWAALRADWEDLMGAVGTGAPPTAHAGRLLQLRPKARDRNERTLAPTADGPAQRPPLGFYLRTGFTASILTTGSGREWMRATGGEPDACP